jgi:hypothetical protein
VISFGGYIPALDGGNNTPVTTKSPKKRRFLSIIFFQAILVRWYKLCCPPPNSPGFGLNIGGTMIPIAELQLVAAIGYSLIYMLFGGGLFGAVVIFFIAKMLGR